MVSDLTEQQWQHSEFEDEITVSLSIGILIQPIQMSLQVSWEMSPSSDNTGYWTLECATKQKNTF